MIAILAGHSLNESNALAGIGSFLLACIGGWVAVLRYLSNKKPTQTIASVTTELVAQLTAQWEEELANRRSRFSDQTTIPLTWVQTRRKVAASAADIIGARAAGLEVRLKLDGRLESGNTQEIDRLASGFEQIPTRRLVILGEPGSGKTFLAIALAIGLLKRWRPGAPVPVFLELSSWDPVEESLDAWIVRTIAANHYGGEESLPRTILDARLIMPVLDGLDEIPEATRRRAVDEINKTLRHPRNLVLTCRATEYEDVVAGGAPVLLRAPVVEITPVSLDDLTDCLARQAAAMEPVGARQWGRTIDHLKVNRDGILASALSTPLMVSLFCVAYADSSRDPTELLNEEKYPTKHNVEDQLVDLLVDTAYPDSAPGRTSWITPRWNAQQARRWLTLCAKDLHRHNERDLAWWQLPQRLLSPWAALLVGIGIGLTTLFICIALLAVFPRIRDNLTLFRFDESGTTGPPFTGLDNFIYGMVAPAGVVAAVMAVVVTPLWFAGSRREPARLGLARGAARARFRKGMLAGAVMILVPGVPLMVMVMIGYARKGAGTYAMGFFEITAAFVSLMVTAGFTLLSGAAIALHELLTAPSTQPGRASPEDFLRQDRKSSIVGSFAAGLLVAVLWIPVTIGTGVLGVQGGQRLAVWLGESGVIVFNPTTPELEVLFYGLNISELVVVSFLWAILFSILVLVTRAWPRFVMARLLLAATRALPLRLMTFLADAQRRGLLRKSGGRYQFWHIRLQERLVLSSTRSANRAASRPPRTFTVISVALVLSSIVVVVVLTQSDSCPGTRIEGLDDNMARSVAGESSACMGVLPEEDWDELAVSAIGHDALDQILAANRRGLRRAEQINSGDDDGWSATFSYIGVVGNFTHADVTDLGEYLSGVAAAQEISTENTERMIAEKQAAASSTQSEQQAVEVAEFMGVQLIYTDTGTQDNTTLRNLSGQFLDNEYPIGAVHLVMESGYPYTSDYTPVVGIRSADATEVATTFAKAWHDTHIYSDQGSAAVPSRDLANGIDGVECEKLSANVSTGQLVDLTGVVVGDALLHQIDNCAQTSLTVLVDADNAKNLAVLGQQRDISLVYVRNQVDLSIQDCERRLWATTPYSPDKAAAACVGTLAASSQLRLSMEPVENNP